MRILRTSIIASGAVLVSACESLPDPVAERGDCQIRAGYAVAEGSAQPWGGGQGSGGAYTRIGQCDTGRDFVYARTANGWACHGPEAFCIAAYENRPVEVPADELRALQDAARAAQVPAAAPECLGEPRPPAGDWWCDPGFGWTERMP